MRNRAKGARRARGGQPGSAGGKAGIFAGFGTFLRSFRRYWGVLAWLVHDSAWRFKVKVVLILLIGFIGALLRASAIGQAIYYAKFLDVGRTISILGYRFDPRSSVLLLVLFAGGVLLTLLLSGWMIYYARSRSIRLGCRYDALCSKRVLSVLASSQRIWTPPGEKLPSDAPIIRLATLDSRYCGRVLRLLLTAFIPAITFAIYLAILLYMHTLATAIVSAFVGLSAVFLYRINKTGVQHSMQYEERSALSRGEKSNILKFLGGMTLLSDDLSWLDEPFESGQTRQHGYAYEGRLVVLEHSRLLSDILTALLVCGVLLFFTGSALTRGTGWGILIAYLVVLRLCMGNLQALSRTITGVNRFYPQVKRYRDFIRSTGVPLTGEQGEPGIHDLAVSGETIQGSMQKWTLQKGQRLGLVSPVPLNRYSLAFLVGRVLSPAEAELEAALGTTWFATAGCVAPPVALRSFLAMPPGASWPEAFEPLADTQLLPKIAEQLDRDLDTVLTPNRWDALDTDVKAALALLAGLRSPCRWILAEAEALGTLSDAARQRVLDRLRDRIVLIVFSGDIDAIGKYGEDTIAVIDEDGIIALGSPDWVKAHRDILEKRLAPTRDLYRRGGVEDQEEEDEDLAEG